MPPLMCWPSQPAVAGTLPGPAGGQILMLPKSSLFIIQKPPPFFSRTLDFGMWISHYLPKLTGRTILGLAFNHWVCCSRTKIKGGSTIIGVAFRTLLRAVSPTAKTPAFLLLPKLGTLVPFFSFSAFSSSVRTGYMSIPCRISSPRIRNTFRAPAKATAVKGTKRVSTVLAPGESHFKRGTVAFSPRATEQEAETARK